MKFRRQLIIGFIVTLLLMTVGLVACSSNNEPGDKLTTDNSPTLSTAPSENATSTDNITQINTTDLDSLTLFAQNCAACHGPTGVGTTIAPSLNSAELRTRLDDDALRDTISNGRPGTAMPVWGNTLSPAQIDVLVDLIRHWPELDDEALAQLQEEVETAVGFNRVGSSMMGIGMMEPDMMNGHMDWQDMVPPITPYPGQNPAWGHHGMNGNNGSWQGDGCCGQGMIRPGN